MSRVFLTILSLAVACVVTACGVAAAPPSAAAAAPPEVTVAHPLARTTIDWEGYVGQFEPMQRVDVRPRVPGYLREVHFKDGDLVERGQLLFTIDARPFEAKRDEARGRVAAAQAQAANARTELERA